MAAYCFGRVPPFSYQAPWETQPGSKAVQSAPLCGWRSAHGTCRQLAAVAGQQGSIAGDGSSSGRGSSSSRHGSKSGSGSGSKSSGRPSSQAQVESILASAGLNSAELQLENPDAYSLLTVPLARVLAEVHMDRLTTKARLLLRPAQLMARICFLAYDVGLTAEHLRARHGQKTDLLRFDLEGARQLLAWLRSQQVSNSQLQLASLSNPQLWATDVTAAQRSKQHVQQRLGVTDAQWVESFALHLGGLVARPEVLDGVIAWLKAEPLGLSTAEIAQLWRCIPQFFATPAPTLQHNLERLLSRCPLSQQQLRSFMRGPCSLLWRDCEGLVAKLDSLVAELPGLEARLDRLLVLGGTALNLETEVLLGKASCLLQYGFDKEELSSVILQNPMVLMCSWDGKLHPTLKSLDAVLGSQQAVVAAVSKAPQLLGTALDTLMDNFHALKQLGLTDSEVQGLAARDPQLLAYRFGSAEFQATLRYFEIVLGKPPHLMLVQHPSYLRGSLRRIDYKVSFMKHKGDTHYKASLTWVKLSDEKFCQQYKYSLPEFRAWEAQWLRSERAREYGLDKDRLSGMGRALAARQKRRKAQVTARRKQLLAGVDSDVDGAV